VRFVFVDRILALERGQSILALKNVSASEDVFDTHFPGHPIFPGALILEALEQASQALIGSTYAFTRVGRLARVTGATFRRIVRPGDQLHVRCVREEPGREGEWRVAGSVEVEGRLAATAMLEFTVTFPAAGEAARIQELVRVAQVGPDSPSLAP
jgi:3-hydroxyacyl-[acyl-carrier-protein] dehydratase